MFVFKLNKSGFILSLKSNYYFSTLPLYRGTFLDTHRRIISCGRQNLMLALMKDLYKNHLQFQQTINLHYVVRIMPKKKQSPLYHFLSINLDFNAVKVKALIREWALFFYFRYFFFSSHNSLRSICINNYIF